MVHVRQVDAEVVLQQGLAELFLGFEVMVERALGNARGLQDFVEADSGEAFDRHDPVSGIEQMLAGVVVAGFHGAHGSLN